MCYLKLIQIFGINKNITTEDVIPKVTKSESESNCIPKTEFTFKSLAKKPSKKSHTKPRTTNNNKCSRLPESPETTATQPKKDSIK